MASATLYPPIIDGYIPAIAGDDANIVVPFTFSKFNAAAADTYIADSNFSVHATVCENISGRTAVDTTASDLVTNIFTATGVILNLTATKVRDGLYQIVIPRDKLQTLSIGKKYKIQLRFSDIRCATPESQAAWMSENAGHFSEWSTICIIKYTAVPQIQFKNPVAEILDTHLKTGITYHNENLLIYGNFLTTDSTEYLTNYRIDLYPYLDGIEGELFDTSGDVEADLNNKNTFNYELKKDMVNNTTYHAKFTYQTNNYYEDTYTLEITVELSSSTCRLAIDTIDFNDAYSSITSQSLEEDEGRVVLFVKKDTGQSYIRDKIYRIKRYSSKDLFQQSEIIGSFKIGNLSSQDGVIGPFYDDTIESGVYYKYGIQELVSEENQTYTALKKTNEIIRMFDFSFLVGNNKALRRKQQLKLMFNQTLDNFSIVVNDSQITTLGGKYPFVTRNGDTEYKQFPVNGLISFNMDENKLFVDEIDIYGSLELKNKYLEYNEQHGIGLLNDVFYEKKFRDYVLNFLYEDNVKLFKSPTEGNLLIRITNISCSPNQSLNKMIYSFSGTALEIADMTLDNCEKYKILNKDLGIITALTVLS